MEEVTHEHRSLTHRIRHRLTLSGKASAARTRHCGLAVQRDANTLVGTMPRTTVAAGQPIDLPTESGENADALRQHPFRRRLPRHRPCPDTTRARILRGLEPGPGRRRPHDTGRAQYHLEEFYWAPLHTVPAIGDRQQIFQDTAAAYCSAVTTLAADVAAADLRSRGLTDFRQFLTDHTAGRPFTALAADTHRLRKDLDGICYCLQITGNRIRVTRYDAEPDYSAAVQDTFARFQQGAVKDYRVAFPAYPAMNHVEAGVLHLVAEIYGASSPTSTGTARIIRTSSTPPSRRSTVTCSSTWRTWITSTR